MRAIGGYFELADREVEGNYPVNGVRLNTSRNSLEYIIKSLPNCKHIFLPFYTCEVVLQPFKRLPNIEYSFYHVNEKLEIVDDIQLLEGEYLIVNNYFGIKDAYIAELANKYSNQLIVDNAQALFSPVLTGIKAIYSARNFVGVADGGFAVGVSAWEAINYEMDDAWRYDSHLYIRKEQGAEAGFKDFQSNEYKLDNQPIRRMASQTEDILRHIDYESVIAKRKANYKHLHKHLGALNQIEIPEIDSFVCPMVYPYLCKDDSLRTKLISEQVFVATYWPNVVD